jgi:hypothetical protein
VKRVLMVPEGMIESKGSKLAQFVDTDKAGGSAVVSFRLRGESFTDKLEELKSFVGGRYGRSMEGMRPIGQRILLRQEFVKWVLTRRQILDYVATALDPKNREFENQKWVVVKLGNCAEEPFFPF